MPDLARPVAMGSGEGSTIHGPVGGPLTFKECSEQTNGAMTTFESVIPPNRDRR